MNRPRRWLLTGLSVLLCGACAADYARAQPATSRPATSRPVRTPRQADPAAIAARELLKEAQDAVKANKPFPRTASDYFTDKDKPTEAQIIGQLGTELSRNPNMDAYVKWQLLSAVPEKFAPENAINATKALVLRSPPLTPVPGAVEDGRKLLERETYQYRNMAIDATGRLPPATEALVDDINRQVADEMQRIARENALRLTYRDELIKKIPIDDPATQATLLKARLEDAWVRAAAGLDAEQVFRATANDMRTWAALAEKNALTGMADFVRDYTRRKPPEVWETFEYDARTRKYEWHGRPAGIETRKLTDLEKDLRAMAQKATPMR